MNYYRRYVGDYLRDTARLSIIDHGAYNLLLDYYYADEQPLPLDHQELYTMVRAMRSEDRKAIDKVLSLFFTQEPDGYHQKRVDHEIEVSKKARQNGKQGGRPVTGTLTGFEPEHKPEIEPLSLTGIVTETLTGSGHPPTTNHQPPASNHQPPCNSKPLPGKPGAKLFPDGFSRFWEAWPSSERKQAKGKCLSVWVRKGCESITEQILAHLVALKATEGWKGGFIPAPLVYLNQARWEGADLGVAEQRERKLVLP